MINEAPLISTHFIDSLNTWYPNRDQCGWVLGAVIETQGPVYRKTGSLMLLSDDGQRLGLLSGGCLESELLNEAQKVLALGKSKILTFDSQDEGGIAWKLGIGCGGMAKIILHAVDEANDYLGLAQLRELLNNGQAANYQLSVSNERPSNERPSNTPHSIEPVKRAFKKRIHGYSDETHLHTQVNPAPHLLIFGAGMDMLIMANLASTLGWQVSLVDRRPANFRRANTDKRFTVYSQLVNDQASELSKALSKTLVEKVDAVFVGTHSLQMDAEAIQFLANSKTESLSYIGLLGPLKRREKVFTMAELAVDQIQLSGPAGLALGGDLPESVALAVLAEAHAVIYGENAQPLASAYLND